MMQPQHDISFKQVPKVFISPILGKGDLVTVKEEYLEDLGIQHSLATNVYRVLELSMSKNHKSLLLKVGPGGKSRESYEVTAEMIDKFGEIS